MLVHCDESQRLMTFASYRSFEGQPSEKDLLDHIPLIGEAVKRDKDLANSEVLIHFSFVLLFFFFLESSIK